MKTSGTFGTIVIFRTEEFPDREDEDGERENLVMKRKGEDPFYGKNKEKKWKV